eukprot:6489791-Amphidinium_carterae.1
MEDIPDGPMATAMDFSDHDMSVTQPLGTHAETINSSAQSSIGELPPQIGMALPTTVLGMGPIGTDALGTDASVVPTGTHIAPMSPYNDASAPTVPALPSDVVMAEVDGDDTPAPWSPPDFTMHPDDFPVVIPNAALAVSPNTVGTHSAEEEQGFEQDEGMVTPEEEADFGSQHEGEEGMESAEEPEPDDECETTSQAVPSPPLGTDAAAAKAWTQKVDTDPRDVRAASSGGNQVPTLKRPMLKVPNNPEPEGEPGTPPAKKAGIPSRGMRRPKSPPPPLRKPPPQAVPAGEPAEIPLPAGVPPMEPLSATAEMALRCAWGAIEEGSAHSHNFLLACYYLVNHRTGGNRDNMNTPHPGMLGSVLVAMNPRMNDRFSCKFCTTVAKGGGKHKGREYRFHTCAELIDHLMSFHLGTQQRQQHEEMISEGITIRQMMYYFFNRDIVTHPLPYGTLGMMPKSIPNHFCGSHNRRIGDHPFYFNQAGERPDHEGPYYPGHGKGDGGIPTHGKGNDGIPPGKGKGEPRGGKIGPPAMRGPPAKQMPDMPVPKDLT